MKTLRARQAGLGSIGWLCVLAIGAFLITFATKVGPVYMDYWSVKKALDDLVASNQNAAMPKSEFIKVLEKNMEVNRIEAFAAKDVRITDTASGRQIDASYEKRVPLMANLDVVVKFDKLQYTIKGSQ